MGALVKNDPQAGRDAGASEGFGGGITPLRVPPSQKSCREAVPAPLRPSEYSASLGFKEEAMTVSVLQVDDRAPFRAVTPSLEATLEAVMNAG